MDELATAADKLRALLAGKRWFGGVELATTTDGGPALRVIHNGPVCPVGPTEGPVGFVDEFPVFLRLQSFNEFADLAERCEV